MSWAEVYPWRSPQAGAPVIRQVYDQVRGAIMSGALKPGGRLPSSRDFAARLGVARASVVAAYEQLLAEGYAASRGGSGTYVSGDLSGVTELRPAVVEPRSAPPSIPDRVRAGYSLNPNMPANRVACSWRISTISRPMITRSV